MHDALATAHLVEAARGGDTDARDELIEAWLPVVLRWCKCLGGPLVDPEEAAHDVLLLAVRRLERLRDTTSFPAWLFGMTRRVLSERRRNGWLRRWIPGALAELVDGQAGPARRREQNETIERVQAVVDGLSVDLREALVLCDIEERTDEEAAALLGVPVGTLKSRLNRARTRFERAARAAGLAPDPSLCGDEP